MSLFRFSSPLLADDSVSVDLRDTTAVLRPLRAGEVDPLQAVFDGMSPASRAARYLTGVARLTATMRAVLTDVDGLHHVAWLASIDGRAVGIGRYIKVAPCTAEVAFEVVDAHHGRGIGAALLDTVTTVAAVSGIRRLQASVLSSNTPSLRLLEDVGLVFRGSQGVLEGEGPLRLLQRPRVERPAVVRIALSPADEVSAWASADSC